jgi:hypothetical protein
MTVVELISLAEARILYLSAQRETAIRLGDTVQLTQIEAELGETQTTLEQLSALV